MTEPTTPAVPTTTEADAAAKKHILLVFAGLMVTMLLASLDQMIFSTALPTIVGELNGVNHMLWVTTAYILVGIHLEERDLMDLFGDEYRRNRQRVGMVGGAGEQGRLGERDREIRAPGHPVESARLVDGQDARQHHLHDRPRRQPGPAGGGTRADAPVEACREFVEPRTAR